MILLKKKFLYLLFLIVFSFPFVNGQIDETSKFSDNVTVLGSLNVTGEAWVNGSKVCTLNGVNCPAGVVDTNESVRFNELVSFDCPNGELVIGVFSNGTVKCEDDTAAGIATLWEIGVVIGIFGTVFLSYYNFSLLDKESFMGGGSSE